MLWIGRLIHFIHLSISKSLGVTVETLYIGTITGKGTELTDGEKEGSYVVCAGEQVLCRWFQAVLYRSIWIGREMVWE